MKKKTDKKISKFLFWLAIVSFLVTLAEGILYYSAEQYPDALIRWMLITQNSIKAFSFNSSISLDNVSSMLQNSKNEIEIAIGYAYAVAIFTAPYCTLSYLYKLVERYLRLKMWRFFHSNKKGCIIFGYNEEVKALLNGYNEDGSKSNRESAKGFDKIKNAVKTWLEKIIDLINTIRYWNDKDRERPYRIHVVAPDILEADELELLNKGIILHKIDCLKMKENQLKYFFRQMELKYTEKIILFETSSARNFSLYQMFRKFEKEDAEEFFPDKAIKFFCRCEDDGIHRILEGYHDDMLNENNPDTKGEPSVEDKSDAKDKPSTEDESNIKGEPSAEDKLDKQNQLSVEEKSVAEKNTKITKITKICSDLEIISIPELRIRKILSEKPLHQYYMRNRESQNATLEEMKQWDLHLLIIGFGKLGQQLLLQAMNQGVVSSQNKIIIDVIDSDINKKRSVFLNNFNEAYIDKNNENEIHISSNEIDGEFKIRFHRMDIRYQEFYQKLQEYSKKENGGIYTYIAICVKNTDISLHCMSQVQRYLRNYEEADCEKHVPLAIRMEYDKTMAQYLNKDENSYINVVAIEDTESTITLDDLLHGDIDKNAKTYNYIYNMIQLENKIKITEGNKEGQKKKEEQEKTKEDYWNELALFRRNSNRALAFHQHIKNILQESEKQHMYEELLTLLENDNHVWTYACEETEFVSRQNAATYVGELSKMEHRRWCYFMVSYGWKRTNEPKAEKNDDRKENPCLCNWSELMDYKPEYCKYDLMPLLLQYEQDQAKIKNEQ